PSAVPVDQISIDDELHKRAVDRVVGANLAGHLCARPKHTDALLRGPGAVRNHWPNALDDLFERHWRTLRNASAMICLHRSWPIPARRAGWLGCLPASPPLRHERGSGQQRSRDHCPRLIVPDFEKACVLGQHARLWRFVPSCAVHLSSLSAPPTYTLPCSFGRLKLEKFGGMAS